MPIDATTTCYAETLADEPSERQRQAAQILAYTACHQAQATAHPAQREAAILAQQMPLWFRPIVAGDVFAGRILAPLACFSIEAGGFGHHVDQSALAELRADPALAADTRHQLAQAADYWRTRSGEALAQQAIDARDARRCKPTLRWADEPMRLAPLFRIGGLSPDLPRLIDQGLPGLRAAVSGLDPSDPETEALQAAWLSTLATIDQVLATYAHEAEACGAAAIAASCARLRHTAPTCLYDGLQWALILTSAAGVLNFGRVDDAFGPLYAADLAAGRLDEAQAIEWVLGWLRLIASRRTIYNGRVIIGGAGRQHPQAGDAFARILLQATARQRDIEPQVSLRLDAEQDPALFDLGLDALAAGCTYPIFYNDAVNIPAVARAFAVDVATARRYVPYGCGEYTLGPASLDTPNAIINLALILHDVLHGQAPGQDGQPPQWPRIDGLWEDLHQALFLILRDGAHCQVATYEGMLADARLLLPSLLVEGPLERGRSLLDGGIRFCGGTMEVYGQANAADAIVAIEALVYCQQRFTLDQLRQALAADFQGSHAACGALLRRQAKFGNDDARADRCYCRVHDLVCTITRNLAPAVGLHHWLVVNINNWANTALGRHTPATADGRRSGAPLANGNGPSSGNDHEGPSAVLASQAKPDPGLLAGMVQNLKLAREWFAGERGPLKGLLEHYFSRGGTQVMITVSDGAELRRAIADPSTGAHLLVRVGGFSARFIDLPRDCQEEILARTLH